MGRLRTFLPHCLQKVNRVSFGLLSTAECAETLEEDPNVPKSRLALAVPFIGKDVPSKASEFAHPDVTIGLTVMAYRYSGLRANDYSDVVDGIMAQVFTRGGLPGTGRGRPDTRTHTRAHKLLVSYPFARLLNSLPCGGVRGGDMFA